MKREVFCSSSGPELKCLDVGAPEGLKQVPGMGLDTEQEVHSWNPQGKKSFRVHMQAFYICTARHLLKQLPLDNKLSLHLRSLGPFLSLAVEEAI